MSVLIECDNKPVLFVQNTTFEIIYNNIVDKVEQDSVMPSENIQNLIDKLYVGCHGFGTDIAKFLHTANDTIFFASLVKEAIEKAESDFPKLGQDSKNRLWDFHKAILEYAKTLD